MAITTNISLARENMELHVSNHQYDTDGSHYIMLAFQGFAATLVINTQQAEQIAKALLSQVQQIQEKEMEEVTNEVE